MSSSSYFFTFLNALPIIMVATKKTSKPWEPSPYYLRQTEEQERSLWSLALRELAGLNESAVSVR